MDLNPFSGHGALLFRTMPAPKGCPKPHGRVSGAKIVYDLAFGLGRGSVYPCLPLDHQEEQLGSCETPLGFSRNIKGLVLETEAILTPSAQNLARTLAGQSRSKQCLGFGVRFFLERAKAKLARSAGDGERERQECRSMAAHD